MNKPEQSIGPLSEVIGMSIENAKAFILSLYPKNYYVEVVNEGDTVNKNINFSRIRIYVSNGIVTHTSQFL